MQKLEPKIIGFRCTTEDKANIRKYMRENNISKQGNAVRQIVQDFFKGAQSPHVKAPVVAGVKHEAPFHAMLCVEKPSPLITEEVNRFFSGYKSPIIEGLLSIDEFSFRHATIAGGARGLCMLFPATTHDIGAGMYEKET